MEEHFNENYMLTHEYPKAFFEGTIEGLDASSEEQQDVEIKGILTIKGVSKPFESQAITKITGGNLEISGSFEIHPTEFEVDLPKIMFTPVFESVIVNLNTALNVKQKNKMKYLVSTILTLLITTLNLFAQESLLDESTLLQKLRLITCQLSRH